MAEFYDSLLKRDPREAATSDFLVKARDLLGPDPVVQSALAKALGGIAEQTVEGNPVGPGMKNIFSAYGYTPPVTFGEVNPAVALAGVSSRENAARLRAEAALGAGTADDAVKGLRAVIDRLEGYKNTISFADPQRDAKMAADEAMLAYMMGQVIRQFGTEGASALLGQVKGTYAPQPGAPPGPGATPGAGKTLADKVKGKAGKK